LVTVPETIITSAWRGEPRKTSAPKRAMSNRLDAVQIISMAQQARPNPSGQRLERRPQLYTVSTMPRSLSQDVTSTCCSNSFWSTGSMTVLHSGRAVVGIDMMARLLAAWRCRGGGGPATRRSGVLQRPAGPDRPLRPGF
jgi:hypothetical protein